MVTVTIFKYIQSELIKAGHNEIVESSNSKYFKPNLEFLWFSEEDQFITKVLGYDEDVQKITDKLFSGLKLDREEADKHFKRTFINRFADRQINRQTIEAFKMVLVSTFMSRLDYLNRIYRDLDLYITGASQTNQRNVQVNEGSTISDSRSAFADLPQNQVNLDLDDTEMEHATDNTVSRNQQSNQQSTDGETSSESRTYRLDELVKSNGLMEEIFNEFDRKCFLQVW